VPQKIQAPDGHETMLALTDGWLTKVFDPGGSATSLAYRGDGLLDSLTDANGHASEFDKGLLHQTRHTFACRCLERGGSLHALQQLLGQSTVLVTQRYARLSDAAVLAEHRRLEAAESLGGQTGTGIGTGRSGQGLAGHANKLR
jgi:YD repeat-containing protein